MTKCNTKKVGMAKEIKKKYYYLKLQVNNRFTIFILLIKDSVFAAHI